MHHFERGYEGVFVFLSSASDSGFKLSENVGRMFEGVLFFLRLLFFCIAGVPSISFPSPVFLLSRPLSVSILRSPFSVCKFPVSMSFGLSSLSTD
jgi:hypothetical protein